MKKRRHNRREFLGLTGAGVAGLASGSLLSTTVFAETESADTDLRHADLVVFNAKVYTVDSRMPKAEAFAVKGGRFAYVGSGAEAKAFIGRGTQTFDAKQMTIVPGFIDCHNHAGGNMLLYEVLVGNPYEVEFVTIASIIEKLRAKAQKTPAGSWVDGYFFDDTKVKDKRQLNVHDLDQVSTEHPVVVHHRGGHTSFYNSKALELAGVNKNTPNRMGGTYDRDENGELNGRVTDRARDVFNNVGKRRDLHGRAEGAARSRRASIHLQTVRPLWPDQRSPRRRRSLRAPASAGARRTTAPGELRGEWATAGGDDHERHQHRLRRRVDPLWRHLGAHRRWVVLRAHHGAEPALCRHQAAVQRQYHRDAGGSQRLGRSGCSGPAFSSTATPTGTSPSTWCSPLTSGRSRLAPRPDVRPKITHCTLINDDLVRRIKALGAVPAPFTTYAYYNSDKFRFYGEELMKRCMAYRSFFDAGIRAAAGSDFSPGPFAPLMGIQGMVTRTGWNGETWGANQRISVDEALQVNTINGAYNSHEEAIKGSITPGKLADFVLLADDPHTVDREKIKDIEIVRTVTGGSTVYQK